MNSADPDDFLSGNDGITDNPDLFHAVNGISQHQEHSHREKSQNHGRTDNPRPSFCSLLFRNPDTCARSRMLLLKW